MLFAPKYCYGFRCIADACQHSCCIGWEIDVDDETLARYRALPGEIGTRIRASLCEADGVVSFSLCEDGRCPHLDARGLCRIQTALGEGALCEICREHPRFYHTAGGKVEFGIGASCEEAARLILSSKDYASIQTADGVAEGASTEGGFDALEKRRALYALLGDDSRPYAARRAEIAARFALRRTLSGNALRETLAALEYLEQAHRALLLSPKSGEADEAHAPLAERFLAYLVYRHASAAQSEEEFATKVSFALLVESLFTALLQHCPPVEAAITLSEELEYSVENTDTLCFALLAANRA